MIPKINNVLYATDLSPNSAYAFDYATDIADKNDALIHIIHVLEELPFRAKGMIESYLTDEQKDGLANQTNDLKQTIRERLNLFCENVRGKDPECVFRIAGIDVVEGYPAWEILNKAKELNCDIIVMGTHGKGIISHALLGSVAEKVLRRSDKPVFIIPIPDDDTIEIEAI